MWIVIFLIRESEQQKNFQGKFLRPVKFPPVRLCRMPGFRFVEFAINNPIARDFLNWTSDTANPDETFFSSLNFNPQLGIPGTSPTTLGEMQYTCTCTLLTTYLYVCLLTSFVNSFLRFFHTNFGRFFSGRLVTVNPTTRSTPM